MPPQTTMEAARSRLVEASTEDAARFIRSFARSRRELARTVDVGVRGIFSLISLASREISGRLAPFLVVTSDTFDEASSRLIIRELRAALATLRNEASRLMAESLTTSFGLGERVTAQALRSVNVPSIFPTVPPTVLEAALTSTGNVFTEMLTNLGDRIINEVQSSVLGVRSGSQALRRIERMLSTSTEVRRGLRRRIGLGFQAETIVRTETGRIYSQAQQAASEQISDTVPGLTKKWVTTLRERRGHREAERIYAVGGSKGPIPVRQRFEVKDFTRIGTTNFLTLGGRAGAGPQRVVRTASPYTRRGRVITDRMLHPRDPAGSAGNVINCTCLVIEVLPEIEKAMDRASGILRTEDL